jgi:ketosteroid isomerase-like protein
MRSELTRRDLLRTGAGAGATLGIAALGVPGLAKADHKEGGAVGEIYRLQAAFHRAKTIQDLDLMMSLWANDATFANKSTGTTYVGFDQIKSFWQGSGSFTHHRFSLVPSYKTTIEVHGHEAFLYFECHDVGDFATGNFGPGYSSSSSTVRSLLDYLYGLDRD